MFHTKILQELAKDKKKQLLGGEVFNVTPSALNHDFKEGLPIAEITKAMKKASKEKLFRIPENASYT